MEKGIIDILRKHGCLHMKDDYKALFDELISYYKPSKQKSLNITDEEINDLMATAFEGGINYWCGGVKLKEGSLTPEQKEKIKYISDAISLGGTLILEDAESSDTWELTKDKFLAGVVKTLVWGNYLDASELIDNHDAETTDILLQYALFDEIIFG